METKRLEIHILLPERNGTCLRCVERLKEGLMELKGVESVEEDEKDSTLILNVNPLLIPLEKVEERAKRVGIEIAERFVHETISLTGMDCSDCATKIENVISRMEGVAWVSINFTTGKMHIEYDSQKIDLERIVSGIKALGYGVREDLIKGAKTSVFQISGMDCATESSRLEGEIKGLKGIKDYTIDLMGSKLVVRHMPEELPSSAILDAIERAGLKGRVEGEGRVAVRSLIYDRRIITTVASGILLITGILLSISGFSNTLIATAYLLSIIIGGYPIARSGLLAIKHLSLDINFLMTVAVIGAGIIGEWFEGATVTFLFATANLLESFSMERARKAISSLMEIAPAYGVVLRNGEEVSIPVDEIRVGDIIVVKPGDRIALDGRVREGSANVNQAPITGESLPVIRRAGDQVFAGTIDLDGRLQIEVTHSSKDTTLSKIIHMVEEAQASKAPTQSFVDRFARYYTPAVIIGAALVVSIPTLFYGQPFIKWFYRGLVLLVISCPCALVISTPVSIVSALASSARQGVLIKGGVFLEEIGRLSAMVFDKTGTLTKGEIEVAEVLPLDGIDPDYILKIAASIEIHSNHPIAQAIVKRAEERGVRFEQGRGFKSISGKGAWAKVEDILYYVGNHRMFEEMKLCNDELDRIFKSLEEDGNTVVFVGSEERVLGFISLSDTIRKEAPDAIKGISMDGIEKIVMLTGDNATTAEAVADKVGIKEFRAELLPEDKVAVVKELLRDYGKVGFVGDGVNDAPALTAATVGIAMGVAGTDLALESADIALMSDDLSKLPFLYKLSRRTLKIIRTNIILAITVKLIFFALAIPGLATLWMAVLADMGASLIVIFNGLRLLIVEDRG